jgi:hypothetical protein
MALYSWNGLTHGQRLDTDPRYLQQITGTTELEWDALKKPVLAMFELRPDGRLYLPWLCEAANEAAEKIRKLKDSAQAAKIAKNAAKVEIDETEERR